MSDTQERRTPAAEQPAAWQSSTTHRIEWNLDTDTVYASFHCDGGEQAACRMYCLHECEALPCVHGDEGSEAYDPLVVGFGTACGWLPWFDGDPAESYYDGPACKPVDGLIEFIWAGPDEVSWRYAKAVSGV